jgi:hypothetical protein
MARNADVMLGKWKMTESKHFDEYMKALGKLRSGSIKVRRVDIPPSIYLLSLLLFQKLALFIYDSLQVSAWF